MDHMNDKTGEPVLPTWKAVPGIDFLDVSNEGNLRSWFDGRRAEPLLREPRNLTASFDDKGYRIICIRRNGEKKTYRVCRLVLLAFAGRPSDGSQACHGNNIKHDDRIDNLRWGSASDNTNDQVIHGVHRGLFSSGEKHPLAKLNEKEVIEIKALLATGKSPKRIAEQFNVPRTTVSSIKIGKSWRSADHMLNERAK